MFESFKIYINIEISPYELSKTFDRYGYKRQERVSEEGDFASRGGILDIFIVGFDNPVRIEFESDKIISIRSFDVVYGDYTDYHNMVILVSLKGTSLRRLKTRMADLGEEIPINNFVDVEPDDYVVHVEYGIGVYKGIEKVKLDNKYHDNIVIEYANSDRLFLPVNEIHLIQKYIGFEGRPPKVSRLGSMVWKRAKHDTKEGVRSLAKELLTIQAKRQALSGFKFSKDTEWQADLEADFIFKETPDQLRCIKELKSDMESERPMDRLLCGDVGYGKTEVALRAAFKAVMDNKQVAILVPTTILAEQHYLTFTRRLEKFGVSVQMLSRFRSTAEQKEILKDVAARGVDIIIGTHKLLSDNMKFRDLGLVIIDEEQRFGVRHKEKLKKLRHTVDVLTMTATPIPRTLYMSLMGAKDMSILNTPPPDRQPIKTKVCAFDDNVIRQAIKREIDRKGQVFFIHNRIENIDKVMTHIARLVPQAKIARAHGRMSAPELEEVMLDFIHGKKNVLVSTNIIESGIDIPNANTILVNRADTFGLADLYQLRGRVGRFKQEACAYFLIPKGAVLDAPAKKRLRAVAKFTALGSGFKIAMEDLQLRGAGNILGSQQHGYVSMVGFDLYCRLLREAVSECACVKQ
ncbi:MAG: transcription-repair coupling factor [Candidatus Omnitrophica bacterium CG03_land_8_20_14_0_80_43_22]|nr:MAG: transcription-repair coupling factor [Candidatus Omnitrophica bacterium CG03_land_8_20_14_0_80_43_22]